MSVKLSSEVARKGAFIGGCVVVAAALGAISYYGYKRFCAPAVVKPEEKQNQEEDADTTGKDVEVSK